jgi:hypothetical protein
MSKIKSLQQRSGNIPANGSAYELHNERYDLMSHHSAKLNNTPITGYAVIVFRGGPPVARL